MRTCPNCGNETSSYMTGGIRRECDPPLPPREVRYCDSCGITDISKWCLDEMVRISQEAGLYDLPPADQEE